MQIFFQQRSSENLWNKVNLFILRKIESKKDNFALKEKYSLDRVNC